MNVTITQSDGPAAITVSLGGMLLPPSDGNVVAQANAATATAASALAQAQLALTQALAAVQAATAAQAAAQTAATAAAAAAAALAPGPATATTAGLMKPGTNLVVAGGVVSVAPAPTALDLSLCNVQAALAGAVAATLAQSLAGFVDLASFGVRGALDGGGNPIPDDGPFAAAMAYAVNNPVSWGSTGLSAGVTLGAGRVVYLSTTKNVPGAVAFASMGMSAGRIIGLPGGQLTDLLTIAFDPSPGGVSNDYFGRGFPKGNVEFHRIALWLPGRNVGIYGPDPADPGGVQQLHCIWENRNNNDESVATVGNPTISGPNGEAGPVCTANCPAGRHRIDFTSATTFMVSLLNSTVTAGVVGVPLVITNPGGGVTWCSLTVNAGTVASVAGDSMFFRNGASAIYLTNASAGGNNKKLGKPSVNMHHLQAFNAAGDGITCDPTWNGILVATNAQISNCCYGFYGRSVYDGSLFQSSISGCEKGVVFEGSATYTIEKVNAFGANTNNLHITGGGGTGVLTFTSCEVDHSKNGHAVWDTHSGKSVTQLIRCNWNASGTANPNTWSGVYVGANVPASGIVMRGCQFQGSYSNGTSNSDLAAIQLEALTNVYQVDASECAFGDAFPIWGQLVGAGVSGAGPGTSGTPVFLTSPYGGVFWGAGAPRKCNPAMLLAGKPVIMGGLQAGGTDAHRALMVLGAKDSSNAVLLTAVTPSDSTDLPSIQIDSPGGALLGGAYPAILTGPLQTPTLGSGVIVANGTAAATVLPIGTFQGSGVLTLTAAGAAIALTAAQLQTVGLIVVNGTLTATVALQFPAGVMWPGKVINNAVLGGFTLQAKIAGGGAAITIPAGGQAVTADGVSTNFCYKA